MKKTFPNSPEGPTPLGDRQVPGATTADAFAGDRNGIAAEVILRWTIRWCCAAGLLMMALLAQVALGAAPPPTSHQIVRSRPVTRTAHGYLPNLGPVPLRIQTTNAPAPAAKLPPLAMNDVPPPAGTSPVPPADPPLVAPTSSLTHASAGPAGEGAGMEPTRSGVPGPVFRELPASAVEASPIFTPQMLVQFFKPSGSNLVSGAWSVPAFIPPGTPGAASAVKPSSATYRSP